LVVEGAESSEGRVTDKKRVLSKDIVSRFDAGGKVSRVRTIRYYRERRLTDLALQIGIKHGHFYSTKVMPCLPLDTSVTPDNLVFDKNNAWQPEPDEDGVVRISFVHYNTLEDVDAIVEQLKKVLEEL
jgi:selenocysteine lyase/cysteine desulfurase